jgi:hypothetical protein
MGRRSRDKEYQVPNDVSIDMGKNATAAATDDDDDNDDFFFGSVMDASKFGCGTALLEMASLSTVVLSTSTAPPRTMMIVVLGFRPSNVVRLCGMVNG